MDNPIIDHTILPPTESLVNLQNFLDKTSKRNRSNLVGSNGEEVALPAELVVVLKDAVGAMSKGLAITISSVHRRITTNEAAALLGVTRPTLVKLLESGEIPFEQPGRHRRVLLADVLEYRERSSSRRKKALDQMVQITERAGLYESTAEPRKTR